MVLLSGAVWIGICPSDGAEAAKGVRPMLEFDPRDLLLIPFTLAEVFLFWALWQLHKEMRKEKRHRSQTPFRLGSSAQRLFSKAN